jgi:hypothetical protein
LVEQQTRLEAKRFLDDLRAIRAAVVLAVETVGMANFLIFVAHFGNQRLRASGEQQDDFNAEYLFGQF